MEAKKIKRLFAIAIGFILLAALNSFWTSPSKAPAVKTDKITVIDPIAAHITFPDSEELSPASSPAPSTMSAITILPRPKTPLSADTQRNAKKEQAKTSQAPAKSRASLKPKSSTAFATVPSSQEVTAGITMESSPPTPEEIQEMNAKGIVIW